MGLIYLPNESWSRKTRAQIYFYERPCQRSYFKFSTKNLIWNKIAFLASDSLKLAGLAVNLLKKTISKKIYQYSFLYTIL